MPTPQEDIDKLNANLATGEKIVRNGDKLVEYRSPEAIMKARDDLQRQANAGRKRIVYHTQKTRGY